MLAVATKICVGYESYLLYPTSFQQPVTGVYFAGNLTYNELTCFGNRDYLISSYHEVLFCLTYVYSECHGVWGSRSITFETDGSIEVYRVHKLPVESPEEIQHVNASRWLYLSAESHGSSKAFVKEVRQATAEPTFFCARSNNWKNNHNSEFTAHFRPSYYRVRDMIACKRYIIFLVVLLFLVTAFPGLLKILLISSSAYISFVYGLQRFIVVYSTCGVMLLVLPFVRGRRTRRYLWHSVRGLLWKGQVAHVDPASFVISRFTYTLQEHEARDMINQSFKFIDVLFVSSILVFMGSIGMYALFYYDWVDRENRNTMIKACIFVYNILQKAIT